MKRSLRDYRWEQGFTALCKFRAREGHCCPSRYHIERSFNLGSWVTTQRYFKDQLSKERKRRLDSIGFVWNWPDYRWERNFAALLKFKRRKGHCRVPTTSDGNLELGYWVSTQRRRRKVLSAERRARLNKIGFMWNAPKGPLP